MRIIAKLEIKNNQLFKGQKFEGIRYLGDPLKYIKKYYKKGEYFLSHVRYGSRYAGCKTCTV